MLLTTVLGIVLHPAWLAGTVLIATNLVVTSLTDHCALRDLLLRAGAKEREDLFIPGGRIRAEVLATSATPDDHRAERGANAC